MTPASRAADALISFYQHRISPRKGWSCAHRVAHGGPSCSAAVRQILGTRGLLRGTVPTMARFLACYRAASLLLATRTDVRGVCCCGPIPIPFRF
ncbi:membrane protein insertion efficiency factor YidD [Georgenia sp. AZ-5]|uniref:membrane protein insertion efficiency factor YidD n=1 Tax=Georgenia sp. AZ-5 TaxID=3367526 RepID=UPI003754F063